MALALGVACAMALLEKSVLRLMLGLAPGLREEVGEGATVEGALGVALRLAQ